MDLSHNCSSQEPDAVVVVGGKEYPCYRQILSCWSGYFDRAFYQNGLKEANTGRLELSCDKDPEGWELILDLTAQFPKKQLNKQNFGLAWEWFDYLQIASGMDACDEFMATNIIAPLLPKKEITEEPKNLLSKLADLENKCMQVKKSKAACLDILKHVLRVAHYLLADEELFTLVSLMESYKDIRDELWPLLVDFVDPKGTMKKDFDEHLKDAQFPGNLIIQMNMHNPIADRFHSWVQHESAPVSEPLTRSSKRKR